MVWKFNTEAAHKQHSERAARTEPATEGTVSLADTFVFTPPGTTQAAGGPRVEPVLLDDKVMQDHMASFGAGRPGQPVEPGWGAPAPAHPDATLAAVFEEPAQGQAYAQVDLDDFPHTDTAWDIPPFQGTPEELPDLRPLPPAPEDHPGLLYRTVNTFGHAQRMPHDDPSQQLWAEQRRDRGFDDTELWGLDDAFSRFILPRLKALRQRKLEAPTKSMDLAVWYGLLDKMIRAFELLLPEGGGTWSRGSLNDRERAQLQEGLDLFRQYFFALTS